MREREMYVAKIVQLLNSITNADLLKQIYQWIKVTIDKTNKCSV